MELVTLATVFFNRIGSASNFGMTNHLERREVSEIADESLETLRELVISLAEKLGETSGSLRHLQHVNAWNFSSKTGAIVFNIHGANIQYGSPYAECFVFPALKIGERYFKLEEI